MAREMTKEEVIKKLQKSEKIAYDKIVSIVPEQYWGDIDVVLEAMKRLYELMYKEDLLAKVDPKLKEDIDFICRAAEYNSSVLANVSNETEFLLSAVKRHPSIVEHFTIDKALALQLVEQNYEVYEHLPNKLKSDKELVLLCMKLNDEFTDIPENLRADKEIALATIRDGSWWGFNVIKSDLREEIEKELDEIKKFSNGRIKLAELSDNLFLYDVYVNEIKKSVVNVLYNTFKDKVETVDVDIKHAMDKKIATVGKIIDDRCREAKAKKEKEIGDYEV